MGFVSNLALNVVQFEPLDVYTEIGVLPNITADYDIANIESNRLYIFLTIHDDPQILIVQADMNTYPVVTRVTT